MSVLRSRKASLRNAPQTQQAPPARSAASSGKGCCCYILECCDGSYYTGWAVDAERRAKVHSAGRGARYTRARLPVKLVYIEPQPDRATAMRRERAIKRLTRLQKQELIRAGQS